MRNYVYTNEKLIDSYLQQTTARVPGPVRKVKTVGLSLTGPSVQVTEQADGAPSSCHDRVVALTKELSARDMLAFERPIRCPDANETRHFVHETVDACRLVFQSAETRALGLKGLAVWVSDPDPFHVAAKDGRWDFPGTFLYLTEAALDEGGYPSMFWSGCSALQAIRNRIEGRMLPERGPPEEPLGRWSAHHPVKKLQALGATTTGEIRRIETLYLKRYFTNEQAYEHRGRSVRVNDLLAYPLFIAASLSG